MTVKVGSFLPSEVDVDHIDDDKTNDVIGNLQVLSKKDNALKQGILMRQWKHGTLSCYRYCRCQLCVDEHRRYHRELKRNRI